MKNISLTNKRILYIGPVYFHYDKLVISKLLELGAKVDPIEIYPNSLYFRLLKKINISAAENYKLDFYNKAFLKSNYDYVLVRHGHILDNNYFENLRKLNPNAKFINFHWDSLKPEYNYLKITKYFDKVYSFDYKDCQDNTGINYLPLFYIDEYAKHRDCKSNKENKYDLLFIGSWRNKERYNLVKNVFTICENNNLNFYYFLNFSYKAQFDSLKNGVFAKEASNKSLSHNEILEYFSKSNCIIDFPSSFQTGLTIRTFETLGAGKKLITTNKNIINEPFYDPQYISIIDPLNLILDIDFIKNKPNSSLDDKIDNYSLKNYIFKIFHE